MKALEYLFNNPAKCTAVVFGGVILASAAFLKQDDDFTIIPESMKQAVIMQETQNFLIQNSPSPEQEHLAYYMPEIIRCNRPGIEYITMAEFDLLCRVVMSEAGIEPIGCQIAVAETILNRLVMGGFGNTIEEVVYKPYQYSTADNGEPTESVQMAVTNALEMQMFPADMVYFRTDHYHEFGKPYVKIGKTYFSRKEK